jgi:hypothetical protein
MIKIAFPSHGIASDHAASQKISLVCQKHFLMDQKNYCLDVFWQFEQSYDSVLDRNRYDGYMAVYIWEDGGPLATIRSISNVHLNLNMGMQCASSPKMRYNFNEPKDSLVQVRQGVWATRRFELQMSGKWEYQLTIDFQGTDSIIYQGEIDVKSYQKATQSH